MALAQIRGGGGGRFFVYPENHVVILIKDNDQITKQAAGSGMVNCGQYGMVRSTLEREEKKRRKGRFFIIVVFGSLFLSQGRLYVFFAMSVYVYVSKENI
jgi:hypothetical protein